MRIFTDSAFKDLLAQIEKSKDVFRDKIKDQYDEIYRLRQLEHELNYTKPEIERLRTENKNLRSNLEWTEKKVEKADWVISCQKLVLEAYSGLPQLKGAKK